MTLRVYADPALDQSEDPHDGKLPSIIEWYDDRHDGGASDRAPHGAPCAHGHAPEHSGYGLGTFEQQALLGDEDRGTTSTAGFSYKPPTLESASPSLCSGPPMTLLPPLATKPASALPYPPTTTLSSGSGGLGDQMDQPPYRHEYESSMQTSIESMIPAERIKGKCPDLSQNVQAADKKVQAEKHRRSEQERRKGTSCEINNLKSHIPTVFLETILSRSTKLRYTDDGPVSVSEPSRNGVLNIGVIYLQAMEDALTAVYKLVQELYQRIKAFDLQPMEDKLTAVYKLLQELCQRLEAFHAASAANYPTPPDSPKFNKRGSSASSFELVVDLETSLPPSKRSKYESDDADPDADTEWTDWEPDRPKPHEGKPWSSHVLGRMTIIQRRPAARKGRCITRGGGGDKHFCKRRR